MFEYIGMDYFYDSSKRVYWLYMLSALLVALLFFWNKRAVFKEQFSKEVLLHDSAKLDYIYFALVSVIKIVIIIPLLVGVNDVILWIVLLLHETFGYMERIRVSKEWLLLSYTVLLFVVNDFTRYWLHRFMHLVPFLWRFHRVHHAAEVLNPLTFYRVHPVENILFGLRYTVTTGLVTAIFIYFFGAGIGLIEFLGVNILVFVFMLFGSNLRHSHIPLSYPEKVEKWLISPYQHQLHHSTKYTHSNFGSYLAVWDRCFGTLVRAKTVLEKKENITFGLPNEAVTHSLTGALFNPFIKGIKL